jgi:hypothetical protein
LRGGCPYDSQDLLTCIVGKWCMLWRHRQLCMDKDGRNMLKSWGVIASFWHASRHDGTKLWRHIRPVKEWQFLNAIYGKERAKMGLDGGYATWRRTDGRRQTNTPPSLETEAKTQVRVNQEMVGRVRWYCRGDARRE